MLAHLFLLYLAQNKMQHLGVSRVENSISKSQILYYKEASGSCPSSERSLKCGCGYTYRTLSPHLKLLVWFRVTKKLIANTEAFTKYWKRTGKRAMRSSFGTSPFKEVVSNHSRKPRSDGLRTVRSHPPKVLKTLLYPEAGRRVLQKSLGWVYHINSN